MIENDLMALTPLDGRYTETTEPLRAFFSEFSYIRGRARLEIAYLISLSQDAKLIRPLTQGELDLLHNLSDNFSLNDAQEIKTLEGTTRHDVKAIENYLRTRLERTSLADSVPWLHFGLTSELTDIGMKQFLDDWKKVDSM